MPSEQDSGTDKQCLHDAQVMNASPIESKPVEPSAPDATASIVIEETKDPHIHKEINKNHTPIPSIDEESLLNRIRKTDRWMILLTAVIAGTGILGWVVTCKQLNAMNESNRINRDALVSVQRAFVFPKPQIIGAMRDAKGNITLLSFAVDWENSGSTPTKDLTVNIDSKAFDAPPKGDMFPDNTRNLDNSLILGPKATISSDSTRVFGEELKSFQDGKKFLFVWGRARYRDIFTDTAIHRTRFVYEVSWNKQAGAPIIMHYHMFNCADEECDHQEQEEAASRQPAK
ncbi:MAG: hypothetical protein HOP35_02870 [Nitrospira sp.]|nr:hypothetical protein [Nitrospira sp.]